MAGSCPSRAPRRRARRPCAAAPRRRRFAPRGPLTTPALPRFPFTLAPQGQRFSLKLAGEGGDARLLHEETSHFSLAGGFEGGQLIQVFDSATYGRVLALDGVIQLSERDEFAYQEMIVHLPMFAHANPERVLIVGGGDGGVLREVLRHKGVQRAVMCEIDQKVCEVGKRFFGKTLSVEFADPSSADPAKRTRDARALLHYEDASAYMAQHKGEFDVIIVDSSDPVGPAAMLYSSKFYSDMHAALRPGGIVCTQGECQFLHDELIAKVMRDARALYPVVDYAYSTVPTYPSGQIGFIIAQKAGGVAAGGGAASDVRVAKRAVPAEMAAALRYYSAAIHSAAFVLPAFMAAKLADTRLPQHAAHECAAGARALDERERALSERARKLGAAHVDVRLAAVVAIAVAAAAYFVGTRR